MGTKKPSWTSVVALLLGVSLMLSAMPSAAQDYDPDQEVPVPTTLEKSLTKLGRGIANVLLGWTEIGITFDEKMKLGRPLAYLVGVVPVIGTARAVLRTGAGVYEICTFPSSDIETNYDAVLEPDYIF